MSQIRRLLTRLPADNLTTLAMSLLVAVGLVFVTTSSAALGGAGGGSSYVLKQLAFVVAGTSLYIACASIPTAWWNERAFKLMTVGLLLLVLVLIPGIGHRVSGAQRWFRVGSFTLQAGEFMKIALPCFIASIVARKSSDQMESFRVGFLPYMIVLSAISILLLLQPDFGTTALLFAVTLSMVFIAGASTKHIVLTLVACVPAAALLVLGSAYRLKRVMAFLDPWEHRRDIGYQIAESLISLGSGQWFGNGLGLGQQKLYFLPAAHTDFIFAIIGEEAGFVGLAAVAGLFVLLLWRAFGAIGRATDKFTQVFCFGLAACIAYQTLFNMAVVLGLLPPKGITLPFISYGGSSLLASMAMAGIISRIVHDARAKRRRGDENAGHLRINRQALARGVA